ncbi:MAG: hypothetical protein EP312_03125, partial [Gammaproteobacteria bacterium]
MQSVSSPNKLFQRCMLLLVTAGWLLCGLPAQALESLPEGARSPGQKIILLDAVVSPSVEAGGLLEVLVDEDGRKTLDSVLSPESADDWRPGPGFLRSYGYTDSAYWFRVRLKNAETRPISWLFEIAQPE